MWVNMNGVITFEKALIDNSLLCEHSPTNYQIIAPFWTELYIGYNTNNVFYRQTTETDSYRKSQ